MKRTRKEYDKAIAILDEGCHLNAEAPALEAVCELRDSAFALEEALVNLKEKAEAIGRRYMKLVDSGVNGVWRPGEKRELEVREFLLALTKASIASGTDQEGDAAPAPATPLQPHQSEEIMGNGEPEKFTGPSGGLSGAGNSTPGF